MKKIAIVCAMMLSVGCSFDSQKPANTSGTTVNVPKSLGMTYEISGPNKAYAHMKAYYLCAGGFTVVPATHEVKDKDYHVFVTCNEP